MNLNENSIGEFNGPKDRFVARAARYAAAVALALALSSPAFAQYGTGGTGTGTGTGATPGMPGYTSPGYGSGKAIGIGVGAAVAGGVVLYLALRHHHHRSVTGCVQSADDGLHLTDDRNKKTFSIVPSGVDLKPGERVEVTGKQSSAAGGENAFEATKLVKNLGVCGTPAGTTAAQTASRVKYPEQSTLVN
jgi:hypothetical protein